eukprot:g50974.t1
MSESLPSDVAAPTANPLCFMRSTEIKSLPSLREVLESRAGACVEVVLNAGAEPISRDRVSPHVWFDEFESELGPGHKRLWSKIIAFAQARCMFHSFLLRLPTKGMFLHLSSARPAETLQDLAPARAEPRLRGLCAAPLDNALARDRPLLHGLLIGEPSPLQQAVRLTPAEFVSRVLGPSGTVEPARVHELGAVQDLEKAAGSTFWELLWGASSNVEALRLCKDQLGGRLSLHCFKTGRSRAQPIRFSVPMAVCLAEMLIFTASFPNVPSKFALWMFGDLFCTQDVRACPDGSYAGRDPNDQCQFRACPSTGPACYSDVFVCSEGTILTRDASNYCQFPACPCGAGEEWDAYKQIVATTCAAPNACPSGKKCVQFPGTRCLFSPCVQFICVSQSARVPSEGSKGASSWAFDSPLLSALVCKVGEQYDTILKRCVAVSCAAAYACPAGQDCVPQSIQCIRAPCAQFVCRARDTAAGSWGTSSFADLYRQKVSQLGSDANSWTALSGSGANSWSASSAANQPGAYSSGSSAYQTRASTRNRSGSWGV